MPFEIHRKHMVIGFLCLIVLSAYVIVNFDLSVFMKTPSGQWLLQKITFNKEHITRTNTSDIQRKDISVSTEKQIWPLVDKVYNLNSNQNDNKTRTRDFCVLWYNTESWIRENYIEADPMRKCKYNNCYSTADRSFIFRSAAVVYCISCPDMPTIPPVLKAMLPVNQTWIFFSLESPINIPKHDISYRNIQWHDAMNWSMTYRLDSDIHFPYSVLKHRTVPRTRNYTAIFQRKTKTAAWIVSHCYTESRREVFVDEMRKHGLDIDVYGACGKRLTEDPEQLINRDYKFYLAFENSLCKDYITEKFFKYLNFDTIVVVRGGADYSYLLPNDTFIDTSKFKTIKELVSFLMKVSSSEELYTKYMKNKEKYIADLIQVNPFCVMCEKLNNTEKNRNSHHSIVSTVFDNACHEPFDIH